VYGIAWTDCHHKRHIIIWGGGDSLLTRMFGLLCVAFKFQHSIL